MCTTQPPWNQAYVCNYFVIVHRLLKHIIYCLFCLKYNARNNWYQQFENVLQIRKRFDGKYNQIPICSMGYSARRFKTEKKNECLLCSMYLVTFIYFFCSAHKTKYFRINPFYAECKSIRWCRGAVQLCVCLCLFRLCVCLMRSTKRKQKHLKWNFDQK